jgi:S-adenosylmethionine-dependent methyltransferase
MQPAFDERARWFDTHYASTRGRVRRALLLERLHETFPPPPARILDAGGGTGAIAVPLAQLGYQVTLLEPSEGMLDVAHERITAAGLEVVTIAGSIDDAPSLAPDPYDGICCHAVLMYVADPASCLDALRSVAEPGAALSLLEKNRGGLALRPGLMGDYEEAIRVLDDPVAAGNLGIPNRARTVGEWSDLLAGSGWRMDSHVGIRLFSDLEPDDLPAQRFEQLLRLEREAGRRDPYRSVARLVHISATATND